MPLPNKKVIILQNSSVFTVDIAKIANPNYWELHLIVNQKSYACLCKRDQHGLFKTITILEDFNFDNLKNNIDSLIHHASKESIVLATNSESLVSLTGSLREFFRIPGLTADTAKIFSNKVHMKKHLAKFGVSLPNYVSFDRNKYIIFSDNYIKNICEELSFPIIAKPIDSAGSHGVTKIRDINELRQWAATIKTNLFELDEFIDGDLYHCDSLIHKGKIIHTAVCRYSCPTHKFMQGSNLGSITLSINDPTYEKLKVFNDAILNVISTNFSGVTHLEAFEKSDGQLVFLEVANRGGGAGVPKMYAKHLNIDLFSTHFILQCNDNYQIDIHPDHYAAWLQFSPSSNIIGLEDLPKIESDISLISKNENINRNSPCTSLRDYTLSIILWNNNFAQLQQDFSMLSQLRVQVE